MRNQLFLRVGLPSQSPKVGDYDLRAEKAGSAIQILELLDNFLSRSMLVVCGIILRSCQYRRNAKRIGVKLALFNVLKRLEPPEKNYAPR